jgi:hypothetical protein
MSVAAWHHKLTVDNIRPDMPIETPQNIYSLVEQGWHTIPSQRPDASSFVSIMQAVISECGFVREESSQATSR